VGLAGLLGVLAVLAIGWTWRTADGHARTLDASHA
jgi:hypothetical protein